MTISEIRKLYPKPSGQRFNKDSYCVGGAYCLAHRCPHHFPTATIFKIVLINKAGLAPDVAKSVAERVIDLNDRGLFDAAWKALEEALP